MGAKDSRWRAFGLGVGLFLVIWGGKLVVLNHWGSDLPVFDDWPAIGQGAIVPYKQGHFGWRVLFAPNNEHRIAVTRGLDLALSALNGQWDARLECVVSGALHALIVVGAYFVGRTVLPHIGRIIWAGVLLLLTAPPVVWENILRGFDSAQYLLIGFSGITIVAWLASKPGTRWWWAGAVSAVLALFTLGSGLVAGPVVVAVLLATRPWREVWEQHRWTLVAAACLAALGWELLVVVPAHASLRAHDVGEFWTAFYHHLQWPLVRHASFGLISQLPWLWLTWRAIRRDPAIGTAERVVIAIGLWALLHCAAMALMRGSFQPWPPVRGLENIVVALAANAYILLLVWSRARRMSWRAWGGAVVSAVWVFGLVYGIGSIIRENVGIVLPDQGARARRYEASTAAYVATGDRAWLRPNEIPYFDVPGLVSVLDRPEIRAVLPGSVRPPLAVAASESAAATIFRAGAVGPGVSVPPGIVAVGSGTDAGATGEWRSQPIAPGKFGYWRFQVAADPGSTGYLALELRSVGGQLLASVWPQSPLATSSDWQAIVVRAPEIPAVLVARDQSSDGWIAFSGPVEMATGSVLAWSLERRGWWLVVVGAALAVTSGAWSTRTRRTS